MHDLSNTLSQYTLDVWTAESSATPLVRRTILNNYIHNQSKSSIAPLKGRFISSSFQQELLIDENSGHIPHLLVDHQTMSWTLEAGFALAALILTLILSGIGLVLKYRRGLPYSGSSKLGLVQLLAEGTMVQFTNEICSSCR
jgi:hypothetical protein